MRAKQLLNEGIPKRIDELQVTVSVLKKLESVKNPLNCNERDLVELNNSLSAALSAMVSFYYPVLLWISLLRPAMQAVESFQLHVQKTAIALLDDCDTNVKLCINNTADYHVARAKCIKRVHHNPHNLSYAHALGYIGFQRVYAVMSTFEDLLHNLFMVNDFFKKNLSIIEEDNNNKNCFH